MTKYVAGKCNLGELINKANISFDELSNLTSITKIQIYGYVENKKKMNIDNAATVSKALSVSIDDLYEWVETE
jgi:predicted DNA-binding ribbon-helix-helix protein